MKIGRITLLDAALTAAAEERLGPEIDRVVARIFHDPAQVIAVAVADREQLRAALVRLCDVERCPLVVTTGGTGPGPHDFTPEVTLAVVERELPGFGEAIRHYSFQRASVALLSRAVAGVRGSSLVLNLPSRPKAIQGCLYLVREAIVDGIQQITGVRHRLWVKEIVIPLEKYLPFLKRFRVKPDPRFE